MIVSVDVEDRGWEQIPALEEMTRQALAAAAAAARLVGGPREVNVLFTDDRAMADLNGRWRGKPVPTNVLAFPAEDFPAAPGEAKPLGDIVLALGVVAREAAAQGKTLPDHTAHLIIHGFLHLAGFDHDIDEAARAMEARETAILKGLGIDNPYER
ncbi:MAG: rRNA maturation RNase YbeY [Rhizobiales bacterium]|nr:rRNA maturation RNase YbeY [Hyphomicrobiales bacterium]MBI3673257.1 rRNA maturation RNase YbeY [Hyphomicrobiales bacterium]